MDLPTSDFVRAFSLADLAGGAMITRRRMLVAGGGLAALAAAGQALATTVPTTRRMLTMEITRNGSQPSGKGSADWFTGAVRVDPLFQAPDPARARGASVTLRAWRAHGMAHTSPRPDSDRRVRLRLGAGLGRRGRGNPPGGCGLVSAG
jgi:hypothetical protein